MQIHYDITDKSLQKITGAPIKHQNRKCAIMKTFSDIILFLDMLRLIFSVNTILCFDHRSCFYLADYTFFTSRLLSQIYFQKLFVSINFIGLQQEKDKSSQIFLQRIKMKVKTFCKKSTCKCHELLRIFWSSDFPALIITFGTLLFTQKVV